MSFIKAKTTLLIRTTKQFEQIAYDDQSVSIRTGKYELLKIVYDKYLRKD